MDAADVDDNLVARPEAPNAADIVSLGRLLSPGNKDCQDPDQTMDGLPPAAALDVTLQLPSLCPGTFDGRMVLGSTPGLRALGVVGACCQSDSLVWLQGTLWNPSLTSLRWVGQVVHPESGWEGDIWGEHGICAHALENGWRWAAAQREQLSLVRLELLLAGDAEDGAMALVFDDAAARALAAAAPALVVLALAVVNDCGLSEEGEGALLEGCKGLRADGFNINYVRRPCCT